MLHTAAYPLLFLIAAAAASGCVGGGETTAAPDDPLARPGGDPPEGLGTIQGTVLDDASLPIEGATVGLPDVGLLGTTDAQGSFQFVGVEPGAYAVAAQKLGYTSAAKRITVEPDAVATVDFELVAIAIVDPYVDLQSYTGYIECQWSAAPVISGNCLPIQNVLNQNNLPNPTNTNQIGFFAVVEPRDKIVGGLYEMAWEKSTAYTGASMSLSVETENTGLTGGVWAGGSGGSPVRVVVEDAEPYLAIEPDNPENDEIQVRIFASGTGEIVLLQTFDVWSSVFYHANPGPEYSALADE